MYPSPRDILLPPRFSPSNVREVHIRDPQGILNSCLDTRTTFSSYADGWCVKIERDDDSFHFVGDSFRIIIMISVITERKKRRDELHF